MTVNFHNAIEFVIQQSKKCGTYLVGVADHGDIDVRVPAHLLLRDDDLGRESVLRVWHGVIEEANASYHLSDLADSIGSVGRVTVNLKMTILLLLHFLTSLFKLKDA